MSYRPASAVSVFPHLDRASLPQKFAIVVAGSLILAVAAHVAVPFWPVPITLQSLTVLLIGVVTGPVLAAATILAYVAEGLAGLPVFSQGGGVAALVGPTGGYIAGFLPAAVLAGVAARRGWLRTLPGAVAALLLADALIFALGLPWLALSVGWTKAIAGGLTPFLVGDAIKIALAVAVTRLWLDSSKSRS